MFNIADFGLGLLLGVVAWWFLFGWFCVLAFGFDCGLGLDVISRCFLGFGGCVWDWLGTGFLCGFAGARFARLWLVYFGVLGFGVWWCRVWWRFD